MKYVLIGINASFTHSALSIHALYAASKYKKMISIKEFNINQLSEAVLDDLFVLNADVYMFSCYIWNIEFILKIASDLKKIKQCIIVLGGSEVAYTPEYYLQSYDYFDYIISGEGEAMLDHFIDQVNIGESPSSIPGVYTKGKVFSSENLIEYNFTQRAFPYNEQILLDQLSGKIIYYESSRGCPYHCSYCISDLNKRLRYVLIDRVKEELLFFISHKVKQVKFIDRTFNCDAQRAYDIIQFIIENNICTNFHFEICADIMTEKMIDLLSSAPLDFFQIEVGLQSTNPMTLQAVRRNNNLDRFSKVVTKLISNANMHVHADLIALLPYETLKTFQEGFDYLYKIGPHMLQLGFLKLLNGTVLRREADTFNLIYSQTPPYEALSSATMAYTDKRLLKKIAMMIDKYYNSGLFSNTLQYIIKNHFDSPFDFYRNFADFYAHEIFDRRSVSRDELYLIMHRFIFAQSYDSAAQFLIYDYLKNNTLHLPTWLQDQIMIVQQKSIFDFLNQTKNVDIFLPYYIGQKSKEIIKKVMIVKFVIDPQTESKNDTLILFSKEKERSIFDRNRDVIIPENLAHYFD